MVRVHSGLPVLFLRLLGRSAQTPALIDLQVHCTALLAPIAARNPRRRLWSAAEPDAWREGMNSNSRFAILPCGLVRLARGLFHRTQPPRATADEKRVTTPERGAQAR